jgi:hypothetical protein
VSLYLVGLLHFGVDFLEVNCELKLICQSFHSTVSHQLLAYELRGRFLDSDGPFTFDSRAGVRG